MNESKDNKLNGLHLPDKIIQRISGPISMYYLKPNTTTFLKGTKEHLPLVLLWGDFHRENTEMCDDCNCDENGCCFEIYNKDFLKELDKLAETYPIDFYTEYSADFSSSSNPSNILFYHFLEKTVKECHKKTLRSKKEYNRLCPTQYIRWQYADTRYNRYSVESWVFMENRSLLMLSEPELKAYYTEFKKISSTIADKRLITFNILKYINTHININKYPLKSKAYYYKRDGIDMFRQTIDILFQPLSTRESPFTIQSYSNEEQKEYSTSSTDQKLIPHKKYIDLFRVYVSYISKKGYSIIYKQIQKIDSPLKNTDELVTFLSTAFIHCNKDLIVQMDKALIHITSEVKDVLHNCLTNPEFNNGKSDIQSMIDKWNQPEINMFMFLLNLLAKCVVYIEALFLDIYAIFRMMKPPQGSSSPFLSLGFFGDKHSESISKILRLPPYFNYNLDYHVVGSKQTNPKKRCLEIDRPIQLEKDLQEYTEQLLKNPNTQKRYNNYMNVIQKEKNSRQRNEENTNNVTNRKNGGKRNYTRKGRKNKK